MNHLAKRFFSVTKSTASLPKIPLQLFDVTNNEKLPIADRLVNDVKCI